MSAAERMLQEYQAQYRDKEERLRKLEAEIRVLRECESWISEKPEPVIEEPKTVPITPRPAVPPPKKTDAFDMSNVPMRQKGFIHSVIAGGKYTLSSLIQGILIDAGISGNQLADDAGISRNAVKQLILGKKLPYIQTQDKLADAIASYTDISKAKNVVEVAYRNSKKKQQKQALGKSFRELGVEKTA